MGSNIGGSQPRRVSVPPRFGVWARAKVGAKAEPPSVAPPSTRRSRRERFMGPSSGDVSAVQRVIAWADDQHQPPRAGGPVDHEPENRTDASIDLIDEALRAHTDHSRAETITTGDGRDDQGDGVPPGRPGATSGSGKFTKPPARHSRVGQARAFRDALTLARRPQAHRPQSSTKHTGGRWPNERKQPSDAFVAAGGVPATERRP